MRGELERSHGGRALVRNDELAPSSYSTDVLLGSIDCLKALLADVERSNEFDVSSHRESLDQLAGSVGKNPFHGRELGTVPPAPARGRCHTRTAPASVLWRRRRVCSLATIG